MSVCVSVCLPACVVLIATFPARKMMAVVVVMVVMAAAREGGEALCHPICRHLRILDVAFCAVCLPVWQG